MDVVKLGARAPSAPAESWILLTPPTTSWETSRNKARHIERATRSNGPALHMMDWGAPRGLQRLMEVLPKLITTKSTSIRPTVINPYVPMQSARLPWVNVLSCETHGAANAGDERMRKES